MSIWRRAARVARSNLSDLARRAASLGQGRSLEDMSDEELAAELERRRGDQAARAAAAERGERGAEEAEGRRGEAPGPSGASAPAFIAELSPQKRRELRQLYANLELPFGASLEDVKQAYRRLMRQYHPDKFPADPARRQLATQLSQKLARAYNELTKVLREAEKRG
jgi:DnaJ-domain-containing protein 1